MDSMTSMAPTHLRPVAWRRSKRTIRRQSLTRWHIWVDVSRSMWYLIRPSISHLFAGQRLSVAPLATRWIVKSRSQTNALVAKNDELFDNDVASPPAHGERELRGVVLAFHAQ